MNPITCAVNVRFNIASWSLMSIGNVRIKGCLMAKIACLNAVTILWLKRRVARTFAQLSKNLFILPIPTDVWP